MKSLHCLVALVVSLILTFLLACGEQTPTLGGPVATVPAPAGAATSAPSPVTSAPETTEIPRAVAAATPEPGAATTPLPANTPTPEANSEPTPAIVSPTPVPTLASETQAPGPTPVTSGATPTGATTNPTSTPVPEPTVQTPVLQAVIALAITVAPIPTSIPVYSRSEWKHWENHDGDCQDARQEVLVEESLVPVTYKTDRECRVETGRWYGVFTGTYFEDPGDVDVDHMVPLKNAHDSGGWAWSPERKEEYANHLGDDDHLIAVEDNANQSKGAKGPDEWMPPDATYWCQYATDWTQIKARWELTMTKIEVEAVVDMLQRCENPPDVEVEERDYLGTATGDHRPEPTEEPASAAYGSCEEAESAGEQKFQGSRGGGEGFPKEMVPSARDGDGDGIVCER